MSPLPPPGTVIGRLGKYLEDAVLVIVLISLITLATVQIVMRNFFDTGFTWSDELLRLMVLWLAMAAAVAASRDDRHIAIDVLSRFMTGRALSGTRMVITLFSATICGLLAWHSARFVNDARVYEDVLLGNVPAWTLQIIMPIAFALMSYRYLVHSVNYLVELLRGSA